MASESPHLKISRSIQIHLCAHDMVLIVKKELALPLHLFSIVSKCRVLCVVFQVFLDYFYSGTNSA